MIVAAKGKTHMSIIVLKCAVRKIISGKEPMIAEMTAASKYYNALVQIERGRRFTYAQIRSAAVPGLAEIDSALEQVDEWLGEHAGPDGQRGAIRDKRKKASAPREPGGKAHPTKQVDAQQELTEIDILKKWRKDASAIAKPLRKQFDEIVGLALTEHTRRSAALRTEWNAKDTDKHAKRRSDIQARESMLLDPEWPASWRELARLQETTDQLTSWVKEARLLMPGTYYAVQRRDFPTALKRPKPRPDGEPRRPKMRPSFSTKRMRRVGWDLNGITWGELIRGNHSDVTVTEHRQQGRNQRIVMSLRLRAEPRERLQADPSYYRPGCEEWRVVVDVVTRRKIPDDTVVSWAWLVPEETSRDKWDYSVQLTLDPVLPLIVRQRGIGTGNIDLCWTKDGSSLIVAHVNGEPLRLPDSVIPRMHASEGIRSAADKHFDVVRGEIVKMMLPDAIQKMIVGVEGWKSEERLRRVIRTMESMFPWIQTECRRWKEERLARKTDLFASREEVQIWANQSEYQATRDGAHMIWLALWRRKSIHLEQYGNGMRRHAMGHRREFYRITAAKLCTRFEFCEVGGAVNLAALALRDKAEDKPRELHQAARHNRQLAALHEFKDALKAAFGPERYFERSGDEENAAGARGNGKDSGKGEKLKSDEAAE